MNKQLDRILICLLWLLAATLGTSFWLTTMFGFNIFSSQHWQYLAYMQAAQSPIRPAFYISLTVWIIITLAVLYLLIRPNGALRRRIRIGRARRAAVTTTLETTTQSATDAPAATRPEQAAPAMPPRPAAPQIQRPAAVSPITRSAAPAAPTTTPATHAPQPQATSNTTFDELPGIFSSAGYLVKRNPQIGNFKPALFAIGDNEQLWIGGIGIMQAPMDNIMTRLDSVFTDTLDDITINIHGFIIAPTEPVTNPDIMAFPNIEALREYISNHPNHPAETGEAKENFDAYSKYIDTVINYMDKT